MPDFAGDMPDFAGDMPGFKLCVIDRFSTVDFTHSVPEFGLCKKNRRSVPLFTLTPSPTGTRRARASAHARNRIGPSPRPARQAAVRPKSPASTQYAARNTQYPARNPFSKELPARHGTLDVEMPVLLLSLLLILAPPRPRAPVPLPPPTTTITMAAATAAGEARAEARPGQAPPAAREVAVLRPGEKPRIRWTVRNVDLKAAVRSIVVHVLITRQAAPGEEIPSTLRKGSVFDSVLGTDLSPRGATTGVYNTAIHEPGSYLVQVELLDPQGIRRQQCALELRVGAASEGAGP